MSGILRRRLMAGEGGGMNIVSHTLAAQLNVSEIYSGGYASIFMQLSNYFTGDLIGNVSPCFVGDYLYTIAYNGTSSSSRACLLKYDIENNTGSVLGYLPSGITYSYLGGSLITDGTYLYYPYHGVLYRGTTSNSWSSFVTFSSRTTSNSVAICDGDWIWIAERSGTTLYLYNYLGNSLMDTATVTGVPSNGDITIIYDHVSAGVYIVSNSYGTIYYLRYQGSGVPSWTNISAGATFNYYGNASLSCGHLLDNKLYITGLYGQNATLRTSFFQHIFSINLNTGTVSTEYFSPRSSPLSSNLYKDKYIGKASAYGAYLLKTDITLK